MGNMINFHAIGTDDDNLFGIVYEHLALPDSTFLGTRITKKMILENNDLSSSDKKLVNDAVQFVEWLNTLKPETLNISAYVTETLEYIEVAVLKVVLKPDTSNSGKLKLSLINKLAKLFHTLIPYPVILLLELDGELAISLADKRINQADSSKLVIEHFYNSRWFDVVSLKSNEKAFLNDFTLKNVSSINYYELYQDFISMILALDVSYISGYYRLSEISTQGNDLEVNYSLDYYKKTNEELTMILKEYQVLTNELENIRKLISKESSMNTKMQLNIRSNNIKKRIKEISFEL